MGIIAPLIDRMRGGGMQPLGVIRLIYCETISRQKSKWKASLGKVSSCRCGVSYQVCESRRRRHRRFKQTTFLCDVEQQFSLSAAFLNNNDSAESDFFPSSIITVSMQNSRPPGCLLETERRRGSEEEL